MPPRPVEEPQNEEEEEKSEEVEESDLQLDALSDFTRGTLPRDVFERAFKGLRVRVMTGNITDADATAIAVGRIEVLAQEDGFGPGNSREEVARQIWARLESREGELRARLDAEPKEG